VYWVVDVDITGYFNNIPHDKLLKLVEQLVSDRRLLKLLRIWLKAGVMENGQYYDTEIGSPQEELPPQLILLLHKITGFIHMYC
jgi:retron-type reverse transcriptase